MSVGSRAHFFEYVESAKDVGFDKSGLVLRCHAKQRFLILYNIFEIVSRL